MQIVSSSLHNTAGVSDGAVAEAALCLGHGVEYIDTLVNGEGLTQIDGNQILVNEGELAVTVQQILVHRTVTHNGRGEFLSAVSGVTPGEGQAALTHIAGSEMDVVDLDQIGEIVQKTLSQGNILVCVQTGIAAVLILLGLTLGLAVQTNHFVAFFFHLFGEFSGILCSQFAIRSGSLAQLCSIGVGFLVNVAFTQFFLQEVGVVHIVQIAEQFPLLHHIGLFTIELLLGENRVGGKDRLLVQEGVDHNHDHTNHDDNRN